METVQQVCKDLGLMFYIELPNNMGFKTLNDTPNYVLRAIPWFLLLALIEISVGFARGRKLYRVNDTVMSLHLGSFQQMLKMWFEPAIALVFLYVHEEFAFAQLPCDSALTWGFLLCGVDLGYYWSHRFAHEFHFMWLSHSVHHSGEDYNLITALRQGATQSIFSWVFYLPLLLFVHPVCVLAHNQLNTLFQFWIHTEVVGNLGPLEFVFNTASHHRMHHRPPGNCNYGGVLIVWDRLFGTFVPEDRQIDHYGLATQYKSFDPIRANIEHAFRVVANVQSTHGFFAPLKAFFRKRVSHEYVFKPLSLFSPLTTAKDRPSLWTLPSAPKRSKMNGDDETAHHWCLMVWVVASSVVCILFSLYVQIKWNKLTWGERFAYFLWGSLSMASCGRLCDSIHKGKTMETLRLVGAAALVSILRPHTVPFGADRAPLVLMVAFGLWTVCYLTVTCGTSSKKDTTNGKKIN